MTRKRSKHKQANASHLWSEAMNRQVTYISICMTHMVLETAWIDPKSLDCAWTRQQPPRHRAQKRHPESKHLIQMEPVARDFRRTPLCTFLPRFTATWFPPAECNKWKSRSYASMLATHPCQPGLFTLHHPHWLHQSAHHNTLLWSKSPLHFLEHFSRCKCSLLKFSILVLRRGRHILLCVSIHYIRNRNCGCLCFLFWIAGSLVDSESLIVFGSRVSLVNAACFDPPWTLPLRAEWRPQMAFMP